MSNKSIKTKKCKHHKFSFKISEIKGKQYKEKICSSCDMLLKRELYVPENEEEENQENDD